MIRRAMILILMSLTGCAVPAAAQTVPLLQSSFLGGELSPLAAARVTAERYAQSVATLENLIVVPQGPAVRRPGTVYVAAADPNSAVRLLPFRYSSEDVYVLEIRPGRMRVFRQGGLVLSGDAPYELEIPFDADEIPRLQSWQSGNDCYLVSGGSDWPQKLTRVDHNDWSITDADITDGPFLEENLTAVTIAASATTGTDVNLVASANLWQAGHVGSYWRLRDLVGIQTRSATVNEEEEGTTSLTCQSGGHFQWSVSGSFVGTIDLQISYDQGQTWTAYTTMTSSNIATTTDEVYDNDTGQDVLVRAWCTSYTSGAASVRVWIHAYMHTGVVKITAVTDPNHAVADVVRTLASTDPTVRWSEGAWSPVRGFPRAIAAYGDRLVLASTEHQPLTIWFSASGDYERFDSGTGADDDAFAYTLGRAEQDPILWLCSQRQRGLVIGTTGGIFDVQPYDAAAGIRPSNPPVVGNTLAVACAPVTPVLADNVLMVLQRQGRKVREVLYSYEADSLVAPDLTLFAEHLTAGGIVAWAWTNQPYPVLWAARADGTLVAMTYDRNYQIVAWSEHRLGGSGQVESLCVVPGSGQDDVWMCVRRVSSGQTLRYIERLSDWDVGSATADQMFLDCALTYRGTAATTISGLDHLDGQTVSVLADGQPLAAVHVTSGAITLPYAAQTVHVGLPYTSTLTTVRLEAADPAAVTWHRPKAVRRAAVSFYQTLGAKAGPDTANLRTGTWQTGSGGLLLAGAPALFTGDQEYSFPTSFAPDRAVVTIVQDQPLPMTVRAIVALVEVR